MRNELTFKVQIRNDGDVPAGPFNLQEIFGAHSHPTNEVTLNAKSDVSFDVKLTESVDVLPFRFYQKTAVLGLPAHLVTLTWLYTPPPVIEKPKDTSARDPRPAGMTTPPPPAPPPPPASDEQPAVGPAMDAVLP